MNTRALASQSVAASNAPEPNTSDVLSHKSAGKRKLKQAIRRTLKSSDLRFTLQPNHTLEQAWEANIDVVEELIRQNNVAQEEHELAYQCAREVISRDLYQAALRPEQKQRNDEDATNDSRFRKFATKMVNAAADDVQKNVLQRVPDRYEFLPFNSSTLCADDLTKFYSPDGTAVPEKSHNSSWTKANT